MNQKLSQDDRIAVMTFSSVYPHYVEKVTKKGRTVQELHQVIQWLTGLNEKAIQNTIDNQLTFQELFEQSSLNENAELIQGVICGYRIEEIQNPLTKQVRMLDKLVDELARGRSIEKILRH